MVGLAVVVGLVVVVGRFVVGGSVVVVLDVVVVARVVDGETLTSFDELPHATRSSEPATAPSAAVARITRNGLGRCSLMDAPYPS